MASLANAFMLHCNGFSIRKLIKLSLIPKAVPAQAPACCVQAVRVCGCEPHADTYSVRFVSQFSLRKLFRPFRSAF